MLVDFTEAPDDALERLLWLSGVKEQVDKELEAMYAKAYYEARLTGRFATALALGIHSHKRVLAFTRHENERRGRGLKWGDGY